MAGPGCSQQLRTACRSLICCVNMKLDHNGSTWTWDMGISSSGLTCYTSTSAPQCVVSHPWKGKKSDICSTWVNPEDIMLSERALTTGQTLHNSTDTSYMEELNTDGSNVAAWGWDGEDGHSCFMGTHISVCVDGKVLQMDGADACTTMWLNLMPLSSTVKNGPSGLLYVYLTIVLQNDVSNSTQAAV